MTDDLTSTRLKFETDEDEVTVYAVIFSDVEGMEYSEEWLEQLLTHQGHAGLSVSNAAHDEIAELENTIPYL